MWDSTYWPINKPDTWIHRALTLRRLWDGRVQQLGTDERRPVLWVVAKVSLRFLLIGRASDVRRRRCWWWFVSISADWLTVGRAVRWRWCWWLLGSIRALEIDSAIDKGLPKRVSPPEITSKAFNRYLIDIGQVVHPRGDLKPPTRNSLHWLERAEVGAGFGWAVSRSFTTSSPKLSAPSAEVRWGRS